MAPIELPEIADSDASSARASSEHDQAAGGAPRSRSPRAVPEHDPRRPPFARYQVKRDPAELRIPVYTSTTDWDAPLRKADFLYRRHLAELRRHRRAGVQRLAVFDFDNTLFRSPLPNPRLWDDRLLGMLKSTDLGWFHDARTLSAPYLEYTDRHWIRPVVELAQAEARRGDTLVMLLTGRSHAAYRDIVLRLLERCPGLRFDIVVLKETPTRQSPLVSPCIAESPDEVPQSPLTFDYKMGVVEDTIAALPAIREIAMWDDREGQCEKMQHYLDALAARSAGWIRSADIYYVPPQTIYMREANERELIHGLVARYNDRVRAMAGASDGGDAAKLPPGAIRITTYPSHIAVSLSPRSRALLARTVRSPAAWIRAADHMVVAVGEPEPAELEAQIGAAVGERVELVVDAMGAVRDAVIAVRVAEIRARGAARAPPPDTPACITVAHSGPTAARASLAQRITRWRALHAGPLVLDGTVAVHTLTTGELVRPPVVAEPVSIGGLVCARWPELRGRDIGAAVVRVRQRMADQGVANLEENRARIADIVATLF
ncbi:hypothetical protein H4R18_003560 [Coemansia javaensis]|uniref:Swiss Army Knife RNA repair protein HAD domain-containing protein n=1 Tax=Coemansia javaensis TaxID=2761396 RepID=A0A9W8H7I0_9FUNG|nr:hypothetical protein H4R18_003560 [Coemansia javaensis]